MYFLLCVTPTIKWVIQSGTTIRNHFQERLKWYFFRLMSDWVFEEWPSQWVQLPGLRNNGISGKWVYSRTMHICAVFV